MTVNAISKVLKELRQEAVDLTDADLLERYVQRRDEAAFAALLRRHGPMVVGLCRRILRNEADAEDAFQATFLVLVRKAASIRPRAMVSNWLFGVARNTALKAKAMIHKRRSKEKESAARPKSELDEKMWQQVQEVLDEELGRLPEKYRVPILLCELEGKTIKEAARQLDWPQGTLATRLAQGRRMLAKRLSKHGLVLSGGALATLVSQAAASSLPHGLMVSTLKAATLLASGQAVASGMISTTVATLTEGVVKTMLLTKLKIATAVLVVGVLAFGIGGFGMGLFRHSPLAAAQAQEQNDAPKTRPDKEVNKARTDHELIQGTWVYVSLTVGGKKELPDAAAQPQTLTFAGDNVRFLTVDDGGKAVAFHGRFKLDPSRKPKEIDVTELDGERKEKTTGGLYQLDGDTLRLCHPGLPGGDRPSALESKEGSTNYLWTLKRNDKGNFKPVLHSASTRASTWVPIKDVTIDHVDETGGTISVSFGKKEKPTKLVNVPLGKGVSVVASNVLPGSMNHLPFRWEYVKRLQGKVVSVRLSATASGLSVVQICSGND